METLKKLVARVLDVDENTINDASSPNNIESWDSFNGLMIASELEKNFNIKFTMEDVMSVKTFKDIKEILKKHSKTKGVDAN